jgi:hypothetical protein
MRTLLRVLPILMFLSCGTASDSAFERAQYSSCQVMKELNSRGALTMMNTPQAQDLRLSIFNEIYRAIQGTPYASGSGATVALTPCNPVTP